jgi:hypothetical protein
MRINSFKRLGHIDGENCRRVSPVKRLLDSDNCALGFPEGVQHGLARVQEGSESPNASCCNRGIEDPIDGRGHSERPVVISIGSRLGLGYPNSHLTWRRQQSVYDIGKQR